jgi:hypothetical protein
VFPTAWRMIQTEPSRPLSKAGGGGAATPSAATAQEDIAAAIDELERGGGPEGARRASAEGLAGLASRVAHVWRNRGRLREWQRDVRWAMYNKRVRIATEMFSELFGADFDSIIPIYPTGACLRVCVCVFLHKRGARSGEGAAAHLPSCAVATTVLAALHVRCGFSLTAPPVGRGHTGACCSPLQRGSNTHTPAHARNPALPHTRTALTSPPDAQPPLTAWPTSGTPSWPSWSGCRRRWPTRHGTAPSAWPSCASAWPACAARWRRCRATSPRSGTPCCQTCPPPASSQPSARSRRPPWRRR